MNRVGFFKDRRVRKFAEKVAEHENTIFVFGSDTVTENFIRDLIELGLGNKVALIAEKDMLWIDEVGEEVTKLVEERKEEYNKKQIYETIGFQSAEKIIILHKDPTLVQSIIGQIKDISAGPKGPKIILIAQKAPPFDRYLSESQRERFIIVDNIYQVTTKLYNEMKLDLVKPPIITVPVSRKMFGKTAQELDIPNSVILRVVRKDEDTGKDVLLSVTAVLKPLDRLMLYLLDGEQSKNTNFLKFFD